MSVDEMDDVLSIILNAHSSECASMRGRYFLECDCLSWTIYQDMQKHFRALLSDPHDKVKP